MGGAAKGPGSPRALPRLPAAGLVLLALGLLAILFFNVPAGAPERAREMPPDPGHARGEEAVRTQEAGARAAREPASPPPRFGVFGRVRHEEPERRLRFRVELGCGERSIARLEGTTPGDFSWSCPPGSEAAPLYELDLQAAGCVPQRLWVRPSREPLELVLRGSDVSVRWRLAASAEDPLPDSCRAALFDAEDPRDEDRETPLSRFFRGLRASAQPVPPVLERTLRGRPEPSGGFAFVLDGCPEGGHLLWIEREGRGGWAGWVYLQAGRTTDLGTVTLTARRLRVRVTDAETGAPLEGAEVFPAVRLWPVPPGRCTDADGRVRFEAFAGRALFARKRGYAPAFARLTAGELQELRLEPAAAPWVLPARPGTWCFTNGDQRTHFAVAGADGKVRIAPPPARRRPIALFVDPMTWEWEMRTVLHRDGAAQRGRRASLEASVFVGKRPLDWGSIELVDRGGHLYAASVRNGTGHLRRLQPGRWRCTIRVGPQFHDNDHEFYLRPMLHEGRNRLAVRLPDARLRLRLRFEDGNPAAFHKVLLRSRRGTLEGGDISYRIGIAAWTDREGRIEFRALPQTTFELFVRRRSRGGRPGALFSTVLQPAEPWQDVWIR